MDALDRMFHTLVRVARERYPAFLTGSFTVADIHQQILPYRHHRRELGLETNQEYELILMELLTGARGYLDVDERLRDELGKELLSPSPEPSRVRDYADASVSINPAALSAIALPVAGAPREGASSRTALAGETAPGRSPAAGTPAAPAVSPVASAHRCRYCGGDLPSGRALNFCPHCGQNLQVRNCPACGAEVEAGWRFCVACGKSVS